MASEREVTFSDIERAAKGADPQLADLVVRFLNQGDPPPGQPEIPPEDPADAPPAPGRDDWTAKRLKSTVSPNALAAKTATERKVARRQAWEALMATPHPPPRFKLGELLIGLYESGDEVARASLMAIFRDAKVGWGMWQGMKRIYKLAEQRHDAAMLGVVGARIDALQAGRDSRRERDEVSAGTLIYMQRRVWRFLRHLGQSVPEIYPQFAVEVLRNYPASFRFGGTWVAAHIWAHEDLLGETTAYVDGPPGELKKRAFHEAWKLSADPLLRLLEDARNDKVCQFAIRALKKDFAKRLTEVDAAWLARIGHRPFGSVHEFVVEQLDKRADLHKSNLRELGLHEMVLDLLLSDNTKARKYAVDYARAHAEDVGVARLVELADQGAKEVRELALARLEQRSAAEIGVPLLARLLGVGAAEDLAAKKLQELLEPASVEQTLYLDLALGTRKQREFIAKLYSAAKVKVPTAYLCALIDDDRADYRASNSAIKTLDKRDGAEIGQEWFKQAVMGKRARTAWGWLTGGKLAGDDLDVEWLKGLCMRPALRANALSVLGNRKLVAPTAIGAPWLLAMARQADETLSEFAHRYLLESFEPADFAGAETGDVEAGIARLWQLASGADEPEPVRRFASAYLRYHHPVHGPKQREARSLGIKPLLPRKSYTRDRVEPLFFDARADVRRLAAAIASEELLRWGDKRLPYRLADSVYRETRGVAFGVLLALGDEEADPKPPADWLDGVALFALAESPTKATREVALTLIGRHYSTVCGAAVGGASKLAWLMESPDREVRLFAVRLLWDKHRPLGAAEAWTPSRGDGFGGHAGERFDSEQALRDFLRTVMFGLPPGRMERREVVGDAMPDRPLPSSVAKRRLLEVVRDMSVEDRSFAEMALPVLEEFMTSQAKGEWQSCVAALAAIRAAHPDVSSARLPEGRLDTRAAANAAASATSAKRAR